MGLQNIYTTVVAPYSTDIMSPGEWLNYHPEWTTYAERISSLYLFSYAPGDDSLNALCMLDQQHWPGWGIAWLKFSAETGQYIGRTILNGGILFNLTWSQWLGAGPYSKFYRLTQGTLLECDPIWLGATGWSSVISGWSPAPYALSNPCLVNPIDGLAVMCSGGSFAVYNLFASPPTLIGELLSPAYDFTGLGIEDRSRCWVVTGSGVVLKANYAIPRWEVMSAVQSPAPDALKYLVTFDSFRKRVVVFRQRPDAANGACQSQIESYRPIYEAVGLTDPVPVEKVVAKANVRFVSHLYGDAGEGISAQTANVDLLPPVCGTVTSRMAVTELNGVIKMRYLAPSVAGADTLKVWINPHG